LRLDQAYGFFGAALDDGPESQAALGELVPAGDVVVLIEADEKAAPPGMVVFERVVLDQMVAEALKPHAADFAVTPLGDDEAPEMLALATLTKPGPFFERTHQLGRFIGVRQGGALAAMAGERMQPEGFTEVSGVCTHPDHRGRRYAAGLSSQVAVGIVARGETPFLHVLETNTAAIAVYEALGFRLRRKMALTVLGRR
jgi:predicted GNAT family acetyltransferase